jgi:probable F420-dependent oxidoreductase
MDLGSMGIWSGPLRRGDAEEIGAAAAELEALGYGTLWIPGGTGGDVFADAERLLRATARVVVGLGILNLWMHDPADVAVEHARLTEAYPDRFMLGIGISHSRLVEAKGGVYDRPMARTVAFLDALDAEPTPVPVGERMLAALGPKMLALAGERTAGAHPYLITPEHTSFARQVLGSGPLLAPEQKVVLETDPEIARGIARQHLAIYLGLPNYTNNLRRFGITDDDLAGGGSDRLVDAVVAWGDLDRIAARIDQHHSAGADHVAVQVLSAEPTSLPVEDWRRLAEVVL